jgi:uracil-DNA glycosylase
VLSFVKLIPDLNANNRRIVACQRCPDLREYCTEIGIAKRRAYLSWDYWAKPVPSFGDPAARLLIVGLAPGAHGANRTGRMFTGDRSGDFLYRALYRAGFASQPESRERNDGLQLKDAWITATIHCAPPGNRPLPEHIRNCLPYLVRESEIFSERLRVAVVLGKVAFDAWRLVLRDRGRAPRASEVRFGHGLVYELKPTLICSYHPSQQNTSTGKLTQKMLDDVFALARDIIHSGPATDGRRHNP